MSFDHVFIELGLSEDNISAASVTGMAAVRTDRKGKVLAAYSEACRIRGLDAVDIDHVYKQVKETLLDPYPEGYVVVSQHAQAYKGILGPTCFRGKPWLDIAQLAWPLGFCNMIADRNMDTLCKHFGVKMVDMGTMSGNCEALVRVYWAMMKRYRTSLIGEEAVRDFGGEALASARKFLGF